MSRFFGLSINLSNRLRYPYKLLLLASIVILIVMSLTYELVSVENVAVKSSKNELMGIKFNDSLISLFKKIEDYRYLLNMNSLENTKNEDAVLDKKLEIEHAVNTIGNQTEKLADLFSQTKSFDFAKSKWDLIKGKIAQAGLSHPEAILIDLEKFMLTSCDAFGLSLDPQVDTTYLAYAYCLRIPRFIVQAAQARELSVRALMNKSLPESDKRDLWAQKALIQERDVPGILSDIGNAINSNASLATLFESQLENLQSIDNDVDRLNDLVLSARFDLDPKILLSEYDKLLDFSYRLLSDLSTSITHLTQTRVNAFQNTIYINIGLVAIGLLLFIYLFIGVYLSIMNSIRALVKGTEQIAKGNLGLKVELGTKDELSEIASSFNNMRDMLSNIVGTLHQVVSDAKVGQLKNQVDLTGKEGFYKDLLVDLNQMTSVFNDVISDVTSILDVVSHGTLTHKMTREYQGAFGELKIYLNHTVDSLEKLITDIKIATDTINHAVREIVLGNNDLAKRTDQQAASLEETAATMEKITETVKQNTESAKGVNDMAQEATSIATKGGSVVNQVVAMMTTINDSIHEVSDISNVIDNIAFQTNILALNAAVEAARAGEQGRGFSVVASEIRSLAQRSSDSARGIKALLNATVERIASGAKLVEQAGQIMTETVKAISNVTGIMAQIANASVEQSNGIEQVHIAINQIDLVTQQNSALVEEATRASESLGQQTKHMGDLVGVFTVLESAHPDIEKTQKNTKKTNSPLKEKDNKKPNARAAESDEWTEF